MKKKILISVAALVLVALLFTGCMPLFGGSLGLNGTWIAKVGGEDAYKFVIKDDIADFYTMINGSWTPDLVSSYTVILSDNTLKFKAGGVVVYTGTLSSSKKSFTMNLLTYVKR